MINIEEKSKRLDYFDLSRGIAIILVMLGHIYKNESNIIRIWLYSFHLPIFFIISGSLAQYFSYNINFYRNHSDKSI
ncbi:acyltransferase family protein [Clostridium sp. HCP1S3_B4]|uniref:acyltransferase family protein n=1 Tax=unclassified Clostridium TaxID=2614128 RepID=UPI003F8C02F1